jgi:hypothetical protein
MKALNAVVVTFLLLSYAQSVVAEKSESSPAALQKKLHGKWKGQSACQGDLILRADGTFEKPHCGPGDDTFTGAWEMRWDALPLTLVMTCKTSSDPTAVGKKDEVKLIRLDEKELVVSYPSSDFEWQYSREKK